MNGIMPARRGRLALIFSLAFLLTNGLGLGPNLWVNGACGFEESNNEDVVYYASDRHAEGRARVVGEIVEYTGRELRIRVAEDRERKISGKLVLAIETATPPEQVAAEEAYSKRDYAAALKGFQQAIKIEKRRWARRAAVARLIACQRRLARWEQAGELYLKLLEQDAETPYADVIPLAWSPEQLSASLEKQALDWLEREDSSAAVLMGASHLLSSTHRERARDSLEALARNKDSRWSALALAQSWRAALDSVSEKQVAGWARKTESFPKELRAGAYHSLGRSYARLGDHERAALDFLRVSVLYPQEIELAADALFQGAKSLEKLNRPTEALALYNEMLERYPDARDAPRATERAKELKEKPPLEEAESNGATRAAGGPTP